MLKSGSDPKVKKTLVRNCEKKVKPTVKKQVLHDVDAGSAKTQSTKLSGTSMKENELNQPTLCSSEALAHYLSDAKLSAQTAPPLSAEDLNVNKGQNCAKMTKKLNFHYNDRIYKNLIEINANVEHLKKKKDKKSLNSASTKRDIEPNIDDFYEEVQDKDTPPDIPVIKPKFKTVKRVETGQLHKLVSAFENL